MTDTRTESGTTGGRSQGRAAEAYETARTRTREAYAGVRDTASRATRRTAHEIDAHPMAAIAGGLAVGALIAAVLPATRRERELLGDVGHRITDAAREAARTATEAGRQQVEELSENAATKVGNAVIGAVSSTVGGGGGGKS